MKMCKPLFRPGLHVVAELASGLPAMVLEVRVFPVSLRTTAEACMSCHSDITGARACEVTREAGLEVIWVHTRQLELLNHVGLTQQGVQGQLERAHATADGSADGHYQFVLREANG